MTTPYTLPLYLFGREREFQRVGMSDCYQLVMGGELCEVKRYRGATSLVVGGWEKNVEQPEWLAKYAGKSSAFSFTAQAACEALESELVPLATVLAGIAGKQ